MQKLLATLALLALSATSNAAVVAIFGSNSNNAIATFLQNNGHTVVYQSAAAPGADKLAGVDAVIAMREAGNDAVRDFVLGGGLLITEWQAVQWAIDTVKLIDGKTSSNTAIGHGTTITQTDAALALGLGDDGLGSQYADGPRTEFIWQIAEVGAGVDVLATLPNGSPAIIGGAAGDGYVLANSLDWGDSFTGNSASGQWLLNALNIQYRNRIPEPALPALLGLGLTAMLISRRRTAR